MYKGIIFDLDGTLLNTLGDLTSSVNYALKKHGYPTRTIEEIESFIGNGVKMLVTRSVPNGTSDKNILDVLKDFRAYYKEHVDVYTLPYENVLDALRILKEKGLKLAIATNKNIHLVHRLVDKFFPDIFDIYFGEDEANGIYTKPNIVMVEKILEYFNIDRSEVLYVGDSHVDYQTSTASKLDFAFLTYGYITKENYKTIKFKYELNRFNELVDIL